MRKKLLKPPEKDREILLIPDLERIKELKSIYSLWMTAHQPYFFNPGVAIKFLFLENLNVKQKKFVFIDTDRINLNFKIPYVGQYAEIINSEKILFDFKIESKNFFFEKLDAIGEMIEKLEDKRIKENFKRFKNIFLKKIDKHSFLKDVLSESFLEYFEIKRNFCFLSELFDEDYKSFCSEIISRHSKFREIFNNLIDEFKKEFRFRFKNYPFPKLKENELPFWKIVDSKREPLFIEEIRKNSKIFPKAVTLTLFLRLKKTEIFIHGVGGGNYEWIQDRIIERFFGEKKKDFLIISGTFLIKGKRDYPYFFYEIEDLRKTLFQKIQKIT